MIDQVSRFENKLIPADQKRQIEFPLHEIAQIVHSGDSASAMSVFETAIPPHSPGAPPHQHTHEDEIYYILTGEMCFLLDENVVRASAGDTVILPRGRVHANWNLGNVETRALTIVSADAPFEHFFDEVARHLSSQETGSAEGALEAVSSVADTMGVIIDMSKVPKEAESLFTPAQ